MDIKIFCKTGNNFCRLLFSILQKWPMAQCYFKSNLNVEAPNETSQPGNTDLCIFCIFILCTYARTVCATDVEFDHCMVKYLLILLPFVHNQTLVIMVLFFVTHLIFLSFVNGPEKKQIVYGREKALLN